MKSFSVLFIHHGTGIGGAPISLLNLVKNLDPNIFKVKISTLKDGDHVGLFRKEGIEVDIIGASTINFGFNESRKKEWYFLPYYLVVFFVWLYTAFYVAPRYLKKQRADIVHLNSHVLTSWAYAAKRLDFKVILHNREAIARGYFGIRYNILKALIRSNCDHIINISQDNKDRLGISKNSSVVYNFIDIPQEYKLPFIDARQVRKVLYLGGSASIKGYDCVIGSLGHLDDNIIIEVAGHVQDTQSNLNANLISGKIKFLGILNNPYPHINDCDILITPFKNPHFSRPAIEAFAYGKPVIGSNVQGMDEIIDHKVNGLLFEKDNPKELAQAINYLCQNVEVAQEMGKNARKKAIELFSPESSVKKIVSIYYEVKK